MLGFLDTPMGVAYHVVFALAQFLAPLPGGLATAAAIVVFTVAVRLLLAPLSYYAFRGQVSMSALQPRIAQLRKRYANQPDRLQQELTALYRTEASGMLAGCLPLLLQLPFFSIMYRLLQSKTVAGQPNGLLTRDLLTTPLGSHWLTGAGPVSAQGLEFLGLFALLAAVAMLTARAARAASATTMTVPGQPAGLGLLGRIMPYTTLVIAAFVPLAAGLYLLASTSWTVAERAILRRWIPPRQDPANGGDANGGAANGGRAAPWAGSARSRR
jgi:YidC/Oxa1 family membrane protein insertase